MQDRGGKDQDGSEIIAPARPAPPRPSSMQQESPEHGAEELSDVAAAMLKSVQISMDDVFVRVDGLEEEKLEQYFHIADTGRDGRIAGGEALRFFVRTQLPMQVLSSIWQRVRPAELVAHEGEGLNRHQFSLFLRLVAFAQQGYDLSNDGMVLAAMDPDLWADMGYRPLAAPVIENPPQDAKRVEVVREKKSPSCTTPRRQARTLQHARSSTNTPPIAYEVRYPPLHAKESAKLNGLIGVDGFLMAYPSFDNGVLIWGKAEDKIVDIEPEANTTTRSLLRFQYQKEQTPHSACKREDRDAAQSAEVRNITYKSKKITCCHLETTRRILWVADKEGWVSGYSVANINAKTLAKDHLLHQWRASRVGFITSMTVSINNELWTGNNRGVIRVWPHTAGAPTALSVFNPFSEECSKKGRELRKGTFDRAHNSKVLSLHRASNGYTIWSVSSKSILLWDAGSGMCFGAIGSDSTGLNSKPNFFSENSGANIIERNIGLELDPLNGAVLWRPARDDYGYCHSQQESWASLSERGVVELTERITESAGKAVTFFGKLGGKLTSGSMNKQQGSRLDSDFSKDESMSPRKQKAVSSDIFAMIAPQNDTVWVGHLDGTIDIYSGAGKLLDKVSLNASLTCMGEIGREIWVGTVGGEILRIEFDKRIIKGTFKAHKAPIKSITQVGTRAYSLGADGSINGWSASQSYDSNESCWNQYRSLSQTCLSRISLGILAVTWNCGESRPDITSPFFRWIQEHSSDKSIIVVSLQEVEMGGASVALAAAKETLSTKSQEKGNANAQFWANALSSTLGSRNWYNVSMRQLSGMLVIVFARSNLSDSLGEIHTASVACGILGVGGNKGAVAVHLSLYRHRFVFICSHFAAHQHAIDVRNANYHTILQELNFKSIHSIFDDTDEDEDMFDALVASTDVNSGVFTQDNVFARDSIDKSPHALHQVSSQRESGFLKNIDATFWMGDLNYRIDGNYDQVCQLIVSKELSPLLLCDQLKREHKGGKVFKGFIEPEIAFSPTYKFDKGATGEFAYDSSEKKRVPAWCDRILFRGTSPLPSDFALGTDSEVKVDINPVDYNSWMDVIDSDHKPVYGAFEVSLTKLNAGKKRDIVADILRKAAPDIESDGIPRFSISPHSVKLHPFHMPDQMITLQNKGSLPFMYTIRSEKNWDIFEVEVRPAGGTVEPGQSREIFLRANAGVSHRGLLSNDSMTSLKFIVTVYSEFSPGGSLQLHTKSTEFHAILMHDA